MIRCSILPRTAGLYIERLHPNIGKPLPDGFGGELRTVVRVDILGYPAQDKELIQLLDNLPGGDVPGYIQGQAFPSEFIDDDKYPKSTAIGRV